MASATGPFSLNSSKDKTNGLKLKRLIVDGGTEALRNVFLDKHPGMKLEDILNSYQVKLSNLKRRKVITQPQWEELYPASPNKPNIKKFDITLLCVLLRNICGLSAPSTGWDTMPPQSDDSLEANIVRIKWFRNKYAHVPDIGVGGSQFESDWKEISEALVGLGIKQEEIDQLKSDLLDKLRRCDFKAEVEDHCKRFLDGTREWIFEQVKNWFDNPTTEHRALIISGPPGAGKSVISAVICSNFSEQLVGVHFCQHNNSRYNNPNLMLQSLARQMCDVLPQYKKALVNRISPHEVEKLNDMDIPELFSLLFKEPLSDVDDPGRNLHFVIDGVDESEYKGRSELVDMFTSHLHKLPGWIRFVVTTRPEKSIIDKLQKFKPLYIEADDVNNLKDIQLFFEKTIPWSIEQTNKDAIIQILVDQSGGLMLIAFFLTEQVKENLSLLTDMNSLDRLPKGIPAIYNSYFKRLEHELEKNWKIEEEKFLYFLSAIAVARQPLPLDLVSRILSPDEPSLSAERNVRKVISCISSLLPIKDEHLSFFHKSVKDWLVGNSDEDFSINGKDGHTILSELCAQEFDNLKRVETLSQLKVSDSLKYAVPHGIQHMLKVREEYESVEKLVNNYLIDIELIYRKFFVDSGTVINEILLVKEHKTYDMISLSTKENLTTLLNLLRKYSYMLGDYPHSFFQHVLNEGGKDLSPKASHLLNTRYRDIPYLEFVDKVNVTLPITARYYTSNKVVSFDISPKQDYMVCVCENGSIELFSLKTTEREWKVENGFQSSCLNYYNWRHNCYSVVFHPLENVVLPGRLDTVYTISGLCQPGPFSCEGEYSFSSCSFSHNHTRMLTLCRNNDSQLRIWDLDSGQMIKCIDCFSTIISFRFSSDGKLIATTDVIDVFRVYDVENDYAIKHESEQERPSVVISSFNSNSWFCCDMQIERKTKTRRIFILESDHLKDFRSISPDIFLPVGLKAVDEFERVMLGRKRNWFNEVRHTYYLRPFAMLDGEMALTTSPEQDHISMFNVQQLNEIKSNQDEDDVYCLVDNIISLDGSIVYQITRNLEEDNSELSVQRPQTNECCNIIVNSYVSSLVPLKDVRVLLLGKNTIPELWNSDLSKCLECFRQLSGTTRLFPISEDLVGCRAKSKVDIFNTSDRKIVSTSPLPDGSRVLACNRKYEVLMYDDVRHEISLWKSEILWCRNLPLSEGDLIRNPPCFSAEEDKIIVFKQDRKSTDLYILDASIGKYPRPHRFVKKVSVIVDYCFLSVNGNEFLLCNCRNNFLYLISVHSGELLTYLDFGRPLGSLSICLEKSLVVVGFKQSKNIKLIKIRITNECEEPNVSDKNPIPIKRKKNVLKVNDA